MDRRLWIVGQFLLLALIWGGSFPAIAIGLRSLDPILFAAFRYDVAAALLIGYAVVRRYDWQPRERDDWLGVAAGGTLLVAPNALLFVGQQTVPSGVAAILQSLVPIVTALWATLVLPEERLTPRGAVGIGLGLVGVAVIVRPDPATLLDTGLGRVLILGQVAGVALGGVLLQRFSPTMNRSALSGWSMAVGAVVLHAVSSALGEPPAVPATTTGWFAVAYLGVAATGVAFALYFRLLALRGALETSLVAYLVPCVATVVGVVVLDETISPLTFVGFGVVFAGFLLLKRAAVARLVAEIRRELAGTG